MTQMKEVELPAADVSDGKFLLRNLHQVEVQSLSGADVSITVIKSESGVDPVPDQLQKHKISRFVGVWFKNLLIFD